MPSCRITLAGPKSPHEAYPKEIRTLGDHLRRRRLDLGLEQTELARVLSVHLNTISNWENNHKTPFAQHVPRIHGFLSYCPWQSGASFPERLRRAREALGLRQRDLARLLGTSMEVVVGWERGRYLPSKKFRHGIATLLGPILT